MKRFLCVLTALMLLCCMTTAWAETYCKYGNAESPCDISWWVETKTREHCRACRNHVEDKEDPRSYVRLTEWEACSVDEATGQCSICGMKYKTESSEENLEKFLLEYFKINGREAGTAPVDADLSGSTLEIGFAKYFRNTMMERGYLTSESLMVPSEYTLTLPGGTEYAYEGEPVTPEIKMEKTDYGSGVWLESMGQLTIGSPVYTNNTAPGTATVAVDIEVNNGKTYTLTKNFTITGEAPEAERIPGDADGNEGISINDAIAILQRIGGENVSINDANADVNADGQVDLWDALLILQYAAGWEVTLK